VRNAVAHGIEPAAEREARGKRPIGRVEVAFERRGQRVAFLCRDDGRGIDVAAVEAEARRRGLIGPDRRLDPQAAAELLLRGGISTSRGVTELAGRGVGLDVVREAARQLNGEASLRSEAGRGTTVEIRVPLSLSSSRALLVEAAESHLCIPLDAVSRTLQVRDEQVARAGDGESIAVDGHVVPFAHLAQVLRRPASPARQRAWPAAVIRAGGRTVAVAVDRLVGTGEVVVRRLPATVEAEPCIAGATLDAQGTPQLVLDALGVGEAVTGLKRTTEEAVTPARRRVLVIDDSLTTRMLEQSILESAGYEVELASSGEEALERARIGRFDLFLVDVEMPGIDGFEFIRRSQEDPVLRDTPSILVTSRNGPADRRRAEQVGARAYIIKSDFEQGILLETIRDLVR
jgi:two-component system chemotaxis sensor kinase CheA